MERTSTLNAILTIKVHESDELVVASEVVGWIYFAAWTVSFYPQIFENWKRKSVVGLNFDFLTLNVLGFTVYSIYNVGLFWIPSVIKEYQEENQTLILPVKANDLAFGLHAVAACLITIFQCLIYERGDQTVSKICRLIILVMGLYFLAILIAAFAHAFSWNGFLLWASYIKLVITAIKYIPQAYMNFVRKSTEGWSIGNVLLDFTGGTFSILQMAFDVYNFNDWSVITGDPVKFGLGLLSVAFDILFVFQHYVCFRTSRRIAVTDADPADGDCLVCDQDPTVRTINPTGMNYGTANNAFESRHEEET